MGPSGVVTCQEIAVASAASVAYNKDAEHNPGIEEENSSSAIGIVVGLRADRRGPDHRAR